MLLSKQIAVDLNLTACKLKQYMASKLKQFNIPLTPEQFLLIDLLWNQGPMTQQQLATQMHKDKNSVTKLVDAIERKGFAVREQNTQDRRSNIVHLTKLADELKVEAKKSGIFLLDQALVGIDEKEQRDFIATLNKLTINMSVPEASED